MVNLLQQSSENEKKLKEEVSEKNKMNKEVENMNNLLVKSNESNVEEKKKSS